jgi:hypothetical protein
MEPKHSVVEELTTRAPDLVGGIASTGSACLCEHCHGASYGQRPSGQKPLRGTPDSLDGGRLPPGGVLLSGCSLVALPRQEDHR